MSYVQRIAVAAVALTICLLVLSLGRPANNNDSEVVPILTPQVTENTKNTAPSEESPKGNERYPTGPPGNAVKISTIDMLKSTFPLPFPVRPPLDIYDHVTITAAVCSELTAPDSPYVAVLVGRTRLSVTCEAATSNWLANEADAKAFLSQENPSFYIQKWAAGWVFRRRQSAFIFAITGGNDGRAAYVERTWGQRSPTVWYADKWTDDLRPVVDLHPMYLKERFKYLTFKISRIWQRVNEDYGGHYDWYIRLWDDNYFYEESLHNTLGRLDPGKPQMAGKIGWRYLSNSAIFPFAGGGAGWYLSKAGLEKVGTTMPAAEKWFVEFRKRKDIFLPHDIHDEDVFLTAWFHLQNISFVNIPGVEHVSPGLRGKQRCLDDQTLYNLRWKDEETIYFNYPATEPQFRIENATYAYTKPVIWHYMSPTRLVKLETLLYPKRKTEFTGNLPKTNSDRVKPNKKCYPGTPMPLPPRGQSVFEIPLPDPPTQN